MKYLQQIITTGRLTLPIVVLLTALCWVGVYFVTPEPEALAGWSGRLLSFASYLLIGYILIRLNNTYALIRRRASVQSSFFLLFVTACPLLHAFYPANVATIMVLFAAFNLLKCYQSHRPMGNVLNTFMFLGVSSLIVPQFALFVPVFLVGVLIISTLNFKTFIAAILGWVIPYWFLFSYAYFTENMELFYRPFTAMATFQPLSLDNLDVAGLINIAYLFVVFLVSAFYFIINQSKEKISTRLYLSFISLLTFSIFLYILLQPAYALSMQLLLTTGVSVLAAHFFVLTNSRASNLFFICTLLGLLLLFGYNVWMLL
ncbi:hypothetical protein LJC72_04140 [Bacteroides sp. OttesenSCG-928-D19]|nr:hypothetical protein [Bacteroides sp. OttesenSCG-928-N06]MDL2304513.1 hypothetical protein [Bacteroides sp. OttesenSCG-928-D19]